MSGLTALGVVYGDIGTSPLYALRECFFGVHQVPANRDNVLGVLSLILWSLVIVISIKYLVYVMRADNNGEGGILALMALLVPWRRGDSPPRVVVLTLGLFGAALLYGDGMITPAISVLSAVEGLRQATSALDEAIVPIAAVILFLLFVFQQRGTAGVGSVFGPIMVVWFLTLACLGISGIVQNPDVISAVNPTYAIHFFLQNRGSGFLVLGAIFLVVTGGEALYADMGHFSRRVIRTVWFAAVLPSLLLNYFGQGALMLMDPGQNKEPFYQLAPVWMVYPLVILATAATVIASQAIISGAFSLTRQAVFLGVFPRMSIVQTSSKQIGQIYIPMVNWLLLAATLSLVFVFRSSSGLAAAYGVAVSTTMVITTWLAYHVAREKWGWGLFPALAVTVAFLVVDFSFFGANLFRFFAGGWIPLAVGAGVYFIMTTWMKGRVLLAKRLKDKLMTLDDFLDHVRREKPVRVPGTAVFMSADSKDISPILPHHLKLNGSLHEQVVILTVVIEDSPYVTFSERLTVQGHEEGVLQVVVHYGFMQDPDVPSAVRRLQKDYPKIDAEGATYYVGGEVLIPTREQPGMLLWREKAYALMVRNAARPFKFFRLPLNRVIEINIHVEI
ncbi:MAG: potassium transporter Kup [Candidatus Omnitrophica bacterium]|nr:potassium transporter Kup [Candidatus Omnitrophota bacterium]